jgi:hypothetical protein
VLTQGQKPFGILLRKSECAGYHTRHHWPAQDTALRQMPGIEAPDLRIDASERILFDEIN